MSLAQAYYDVNKEAKHLSKLVEKQLTQYNLETLHSSAALIDGPLGPPLLDGGGGGGGGGEELPTCDFWCIFNLYTLLLNVLLFGVLHMKCRL